MIQELKLADRGYEASMTSYFSFHLKNVRMCISCAPMKRRVMTYPIPLNFIRLLSGRYALFCFARQFVFTVVAFQALA